MKYFIKHFWTNQHGFSIIELILASALFVLFSSGAIIAIISGLNGNRLGNEQTIATQYATEGMEAVKSIRNQNWTTLANQSGGANLGVALSGGVWTWSGTSNTLASDTRFVRTITVNTVQRASLPTGNIVASGGTIDPNTFKIVVTTAWNFNSARPESVVLTSYLTKWHTKKGGMLVYGDGATTTDAVKYQTFDANANTWSTAATAYDVDGATTNKALRAVRLYTSSTRNEKIAISRHSNGSSQFIYASVWNGSSWGTPTQLSTWATVTFLDVLNFDGTYLSDGTFMAVYSDNTNIPKYRIWNGLTWGSQGSLTALTASHTPVYIVASARPSSTEVMVAVFTNGAGTITSGQTITEYWNGSSWSAITTQTSGTLISPTNTKRFIDFEWSPNSPTTGILAFVDSSTDKNMTLRLCTASGGVCTWGTKTNSGTAQTNTMGAINIEPRPNANEFQACDKDAGATPTIVCYKTTFSGTTPTISAPVTVAAATDTGIQRSFDIDWKTITGDIMPMVYSDNTAVPKFKKYTASTSTWDASATSITTTGTPGVFKLIRMIPQDQGDDMMVLMSDANLDIFSIFWNGSGNAMYTTPAAKAYTGHGVNGSATTDYWFDYVWDKF